MVDQKLLTDLLKDKTIERIDCSKDDEFILVHFKGGGMVLISAMKWNCSGAKLDFKLSL